MEELLVGAGIVCILAAILTRQLQAAGRKVPLLVSSSRRQALLAGLGGLLVGSAFLAHLADPAAEAVSSVHGAIRPPHATEAPPSVSDSSVETAPQMSGQGASSEGPGTTHDSAIERLDRPALSPEGEDERRTRSRDRKRGP